MRKYRQRIHYTEADKTMMWDRWGFLLAYPNYFTFPDRIPLSGRQRNSSSHEFQRDLVRSRPGAELFWLTFVSLNSRMCNDRVET